MRNVTDLDDSILEYAREHELDYMNLAASEEARFASKMAQLNIEAPDREPRATQSTRITVDLIKDLTTAGLTYSVDGEIYFDTAGSGPFRPAAQVSRWAPARSCKSSRR